MYADNSHKEIFTDEYARVFNRPSVSGRPSPQGERPSVAVVHPFFICPHLSASRSSPSAPQVLVVDRLWPSYHTGGQEMNIRSYHSPYQQLSVMKKPKSLSPIFAMAS
jgi:hypothetical protein